MEYNNLVKSYKSYLRQKLYESDTPYPREPEVSDPDQPPPATPAATPASPPVPYIPDISDPRNPGHARAKTPPAAKPAAKPAAAPDEVQVIVPDGRLTHQQQMEAEQLKQEILKTKAAQRAEDEANKKPRARGFKTSQGDAGYVPYRP